MEILKSTSNTSISLDSQTINTSNEPLLPSDQCQTSSLEDSLNASNATKLANVDFVPSVYAEGSAISCDGAQESVQTEVIENSTSNPLESEKANICEPTKNVSSSEEVHHENDEMKNNVQATSSASIECVEHDICDQSASSLISKSYTKNDFTQDKPTKLQEEVDELASCKETCAEKYPNCGSNRPKSPVYQTDSSDEEAPRMRRRCSVSDNDREDEDDDDDFYFDNEPSHSSCAETVDSANDDVSDKSSSSPQSPQITEPKTTTNQTNKKTDKNSSHPSAVPPLKKDPAYVPREGAFYLHDHREEDSDSDKVDSKSQIPAARCRRPGILAARWGHDMYVEKQQAPRTADDLVRRYGYDIRKHGLENPPTPSQNECESIVQPRRRVEHRESIKKISKKFISPSHSHMQSPNCPPLQKIETNPNLQNSRDRRREDTKSVTLRGVNSDYAMRMKRQYQGNIGTSRKRQQNACQQDLDDQLESDTQINQQNRSHLMSRPNHYNKSRNSGYRKSHPIVCPIQDARLQEHHAVVYKDRRLAGPPNPEVDRLASDLRRVHMNTNRQGPNNNVDPRVSQARPIEKMKHLPSLQRQFNAPQAGKRYSANRHTLPAVSSPSLPPTIQQQQQQQPYATFNTQEIPNAATHEYIRSLDPLLVAGLLQQQRNTGAFGASSLGMLPPTYAIQQPMGFAYPDDIRNHADPRPIRGSGSGMPTYEQ